MDRINSLVEITEKMQVVTIGSCTSSNITYEKVQVLWEKQWVAKAVRTVDTVLFGVRATAGGRVRVDSGTASYVIEGY
jgi:hypothetical protein